MRQGHAARHGSQILCTVTETDVTETETIIHEEAELRLGDGPAGPLAEPVLAVDESA